MLDEATVPQAELYFQLYLHVLVPLHRSLVSAMTRSAAPPLELATTLEDVGQEYVGWPTS